MGMIVIKNRSCKISPGGIITLPLGARKTLGMVPKNGIRVTVAIEGNAVVLRPTIDCAGSRVSPKGQMEMVGSAQTILKTGEARHYWLELHDESQRVILHPYASA